MNTTTLTLGRPGPFSARSAYDWAFAALMIVGGGWAFQHYLPSMDVYEKWILLGAIPAWPHSRSWGYGPSGIVGVILIILLILVLMGRV